MPVQANHSAYFGLAKFYLSQTFQPLTGINLTLASRMSMPLFGANSEIHED